MSFAKARRSHRERAFSVAELFWIILIIILLILILLPSLARARMLSKRAVCAANLRGIGQGCYIYSNDNLDWFPHHYYQPMTTAGRNVAVQWVGTMGSHDFLKISEATTPQKSPDRNHPSRSLFLLVICGNNSPKSFVCPSLREAEDPLRNAESGRDYACQPGINRFDFRGYENLSYGYQLPYGVYAQPRLGMDPRMVLAADKGPYYADGGPGLPGTETTQDKRSEQAAPDFPELREENSAAGLPGKGAWRRYNSRNHGGEGQNVLFVDAHAQFMFTPRGRRAQRQHLHAAIRPHVRRRGPGPRPEAGRVDRPADEHGFVYRAVGGASGSEA